MQHVAPLNCDGVGQNPRPSIGIHSVFNLCIDHVNMHVAHLQGEHAGKFGPLASRVLIDALT
jgi:hypothetical protein